MKTCERCQTSFKCGVQYDTQTDETTPAKQCWCFSLPTLHTKTGFSDCLCPSCLQQLIAQQTKADAQEPDFYFDETGLMVMTRAYHLKRGFCCGSGCRHCPYKK